MTRRAFLALSAAASLALAAAVIVAAGDYADMGMLPGRIATIALPAWAPFATLSVTAKAIRWWPLPAVIVGASWGWVAWIDSRPYVGGGASFAVLWGWAGCVVACLAAAVLLAAGLGDPPSETAWARGDRGGA